MKKVLALVLVVMLSCFATAMADTCVSTTADSFELTGDPSTVKVGAVLIGDENEGYSYAHIKGLKEAAEALGMSEDQIIFKYNVSEDASAYDACADLADAGCNVVFTNSYNHQSYTQQAAAEFPEVQFVAMTGDKANTAGLDNLSNAFNRIFEARYVSGVVAGQKLLEMVNNNELAPENFDENGNIKLGYVGAYPFAEVISGYTSYFLGVRSVVENVVMSVSYVNSWSDITAEAEAANALLADGCVIICQHSDTTGPASATQAVRDSGKNVYCVGYNISMLSVAPTAALSSSTNNWSVYYEYAIKTVINGDKIARNWCGGYAENAVMLTEMGESAVAGNVYSEVASQIADGTLKVFDTNSFTVGGEAVTSAFATDTDGDFVNDADEAIIDGQYMESYFQAAPSFALHIDGITELN